ncbi:MAG: hypothetical protein A2Y78_00035 [Acidobacteria bacterium RBG_13_68_16]|nr:MAG: hypothetical protein A2Y78_00035 [Acidobacteria bacterium RBG_13_68_16]
MTTTNNTATETTMTIPTTREEVIAALVALDVAKWGAAEAEAARAQYRDRSIGLLLNSLVHRPEYDFGADAPAALKAAAKRALTPADRAALRRGG